MRAISLELNHPEPDGVLDRLEIDPAGIIRVLGWFKGALDMTRVPKLFLDKAPLPLLQHFRISRSDVESSETTVTARQSGVVFEYLVRIPPSTQVYEELVVQYADQSAAHLQGPFEFVDPHYRELFTSKEILHRDRIYGSGPSNATIHPEVLALAKTLPGPILDFGCGSGALIAELQACGTEAHGLELNTPQMRRSLKKEVKRYITLYDGSLPLEFPDGRFASVFCSEVLEHIPDYQAAVREISRLARKEAIFTVPDVSAIPLGFRHSVVPWHMLEGTHVNFFNQAGLCHLLRPFFKCVELGRIGACTINDSVFFTSLVAFCSK